MAGKKIGVVIALDGKKEFSQDVANAKKESAMLNSELKKLSTEYKGNANSLEFLSKKQENLSKQTESYQKRAEAARKGMENAQKVSQKAAQRYEELTKALKEAEKSQENMKKSGKEGTKEYQQQSKEVESLQKAVEKQGLECQKCEGKISDWSKKVSDAETDIEKNNQALKKNEKYLKEAQNATDNCAKSINEYGKETTNVISTTKEFGDSLKEGFGEALAEKAVELAFNGLSELGDKAKEAAEYAVEVGSSFEASMSKVQALSGATGSSLEALQNKAQELGRSTQYSATDVADAFSYMALAGWDTDQMLSSILGVLSLAAASEMDLADASDIVTDYISAFGLKASDASHFVDVMATAMSKSNTDTTQLGEAYKNCASTAGTFGYSVEETTAALMTMANSGVKGGEAGTALNAVMVRMATNTKGCADELKKYGVNIYDSNGKMRSLSEILTGTAKAFSGLSDEEKANLAKIVAGQNQYSSFQTILNGMSDAVKESGQSFEDYTEQLKNCDGAAQDMMDTMQDNLQGDMKALDSALEGLGITAYNYIDGPLRAGAQGLTSIINGITDVITPQKNAMDEMYDSVIRSSKEIADNAKKIDDQFTGTLGSAENVGNLATRLEELNNVEDRTAVQKQEMAAIVDQLSQSIPELAGAYDSENDKLSVTNTELEKLVKNYQQTAVQQAVVAATQDLVNQKLEAQIQIDKASEQLDSAQKRRKLLEEERDLITKVQQQQLELVNNPIGADWSNVIDYSTKALKLYEQALKDGVITQEEFNEVQKQVTNNNMDRRLSSINGLYYAGGDAAGIMCASVSELSDKEKELGKVIEDNTKVQEDADKGIQNVTESAKELYDVTVDSTESTEENTDAQKENIDAINATGIAAAGAGAALEGFNKTMEESQDAADAAKTAMRQILDEYNSTMESIKADLQNKISFADKFDGGDDLTTEKMNENLQSWVDGLQNYQYNLQRIRKMTDESGKAIFSPEFIQEIESQGTDAANMLQHMVWTIDNQGEYGVEQLKGINDKFMSAMDITDETAATMAANQTAYEMAMGKLGSTSYDFSDLRDSISQAVASAAEGWEELPEKTSEALEQTIQLAWECGIQIPEGLAEGITSGEISPKQAIEQLNGSIEGTIQGVADIANQAGVRIPKEIQDGINAGGTQAVTAMKELLTLIQQQAEDAQAAGEEVGTATGEGVQSAIKDQQSGVEKAGEEVASAGAQAAKGKKDEYKSAGSSAATQYQEGIISGRSGAVSEAGSMASQAAAALRTWQNSFYTAGYNMAQGVAQGIAAGQSHAVNAAINLAVTTLDSAKKALRIQSPSKRFRDEVGKMIPAGIAQGIEKNKKIATDAASQMSEAILQNATGWLKEYQKNHENSIQNEEWYWKKIISIAKKGSAEYQNAKAELNKLKDPSTIANSAAEQIRTGFGVSGQKITGSGDNVKVEDKDAETYYSEMYDAAKKYLDRYKTLHATSLEQEKAYWAAVRTQIQEGTDAWYNATKRIQELDSQIAQEQEAKEQEREKKEEERQKKAEERQKKAEEARKNRAASQEKILDTYKTYYNVSAKAEMQYWNIARKQFKAGTDERIAADKKYLEAKENYEKQKLELDEEYKEKKEKLEKELSDTVKELQEKREQLVTDRKKDILSSMNGFDAWDATGYTADRMLYNMKTQVEGLKLWQNQFNELSKKGLSKELMEELKEMGPEAAANIYTLNHMTAEQLEEFQKAWDEKNSIAEKQAKKDTKEERAEITEQIEETKKEYKNKLAELKNEYKTSLNELNESLGTGLRGLVEEAGKIGEEMVGSLIAGIQKGGNAGTLLNLNVQPSGKLSEKDKLDAMNDGKFIPYDKREFSLAGGGSGYLADPAEDQESDKKTSKSKNSDSKDSKETKNSDTNKKEDVKSKILNIINSGEKHAKTVSEKEKKEHSDLWQYIVKKYGRILNTGNTKKVAKELGVPASSKPTAKEKQDILNALKKKGLKTGTRNVVEDQLAWLFENNAQEYVLRKSDGAIMQNMLTGDKVINPKGADNLYEFAMNPDGFLNSKGATNAVNTAGIESLNKLLNAHAAGKTSTGEKVDTPEISGKLDELMSKLETLMEKTVESMQGLAVVLNGKAVGELRKEINAENEMATTRKARGRLR